jgi:peptidoglycan/LPS O-acetylase OafA/YrhL
MLATISHGSASFGTRWDDAGLGLLRATFDFIVGMLVAGWYSAGVKRPSRLSLAVLVIVAIILCLPRMPGPIIAAITVFAAFPLLLLASVRHEVPACFISAAALLGDISYPIYVTRRTFRCLLFGPGRSGISGSRLFQRL